MGFRRREPRVAIAYQEVADRRIVHRQETQVQADAGIFVFDLAYIGAVVGEEGDAGPRPAELRDERFSYTATPILLTFKVAVECGRAYSLLIYNDLAGVAKIAHTSKL